MHKATPGIPPDAYLLAELARDNPVALESLMVRYEARIYQFVLKLLKSAELAEEITQDVFIKLWESRAMLGEIDSIAAWMYTIGRNRALNSLKEIAARHLREEQFAALATLEADGEHDILWKDYQGLLASFIEQLPPRRREILKLKIEQGLTTEEISKSLNISPHTVKHQLGKSYLTLRRWVDEFVFFLLLGVLLHPVS
ncbi:RNA polymerase sigma-70 factor, ECF subfamily [Parapedobacter luteus]|uniref:RNA polymerase sigma-70 factor, ECF subfamily n=2 Tax=Sphingobacteriaceae TaxID=84566 RepID=A0A1T5A030_9SPHI|nr:RNA polymerase sigma-70 factor, ECF subfamily [Parapedobacter luteus]